MMINMEGFYGAILRDDPRDWLLGATQEFEIQKNYNTATHEFNQLEFSKTYGNNLCTAYAPIGMLSDLLGRELTEKERGEVVKARVGMKDFDKNVGGYLVEGNNCVRKWYNSKNPDDQIRQIALEAGSSKFIEALEKGHRLNFGYRGNQEFNLDAADGVLDGSSFSDTTYGHSTTCKLSGKYVVVDNYKGIKPKNIYEIKDFLAFMKGGNVFPKSYLFLKVKNMNESQLKRLEAKALGLWNGLDEDKPCSRGEAIEIAMNLKKLLETPK